ncbi:hypothetical protein [Bradyrhizobium zhanjiangense]|uniref:Uncharacterized protein n=1 Tax=Bradyrhizobium zhanjiangense TaxID=1325107 RepID=A0ABY0DC57_9BRAD|nr:hypothetical protein [Bradyrhizobium zhanjiangense]RXG89099.1 hypothetical protein EAS62_31465 [Bradyrhizobium zhanjiangense]
MESRRRLSTSSGLPQMQDDPEQSLAFIEKAREIEADEERPPADELINAREHALSQSSLPNQIEAPGGSDIADFLQYNVYWTTLNHERLWLPI